MSSSKRKRDGDSDDTFPFIQLPVELQNIIVDLACRLPPSEVKKEEHSSSHPAPARPAGCGARGPPRLYVDLAATVSLTLVSRAFYARTIATLYSSVIIGRPTVLAALQRTLASRPLLGTLIRSIYAGPEDRLDDNWKPARDQVDWLLGSDSDRGAILTWLRTTLQSPREEQLLPIWCGPRREWPLDPAAARDCREATIHAALARAQRDLNVQLSYEGSDFSCQSISKELWIKRTLEVQAALDVYLMEMRRIELASGDFTGTWRAWPPGSAEHSPPQRCQAAVCDHYPLLDIVGTLLSHRAATAEKSTNSKPTFVVSRPQLLEHLFRPGSPADRFDHPLVFLHSGVNFAKMENRGRPGAESDEEDYDDEDGYRPNAPGKEGHEDVSVFDEIDVALPATASIPAMLGLARSIFSLTPNLTNLTLTGFLERAFCGRHPPPDLPALHALSLGPPPPFWISKMQLEPPILQRIKKLRLVGVILLPGEIQTVARRIGKLKKFEMTMPAKLDGVLHSYFVEITNGMFGWWPSEKGPLSANGKDLDGAGPTPAQPFHDEDEGEGREDENRKERRPSHGRRQAVEPLITIKVHPDDLDWMLERARTPEIRQALREGHSLPSWAPRRFLIAESRATSLGIKRKTAGAISEAWGVLYEEGKEWWHREAGL